MSKSFPIYFSLTLLTASAQEPADTNAPASQAASTNRTASRVSSRTASTNDPIARIREEGLNHSQIMQTLGYLTDVIGPRLTGSPNLKRANEWTRDRLSSWGLAGAHLESWGPFGRGWSLQRFSAQVVEPQTIALIGYPNAWSPGFAQPLVAEVVYFPGGTNVDLEKYKGKLAGKIVLSGAIREVKAQFEPMAVRLNETNLLKLANAGEPTSTPTPLIIPGRRRRDVEIPAAGGPVASRVSGSATNTTGAGSDPEAGRDPSRRSRQVPRYLPFLAKERAALIVTPSSIGDGGTFFVAAATVPGPEGSGGFSFTNTMRVWMTNAPPIPPQITLAAEDYNRLVRMIQLDESLKMAVDLQVQFHNDDCMAYNTIAEIPGTDLKDEIVMLGAHLDSWHSGTGATDNGAGVAATMEAVRILAALKLQPRRTIRIGLWSGEEQGLLGSKAYVAKHFGYFKTNSPSSSSSSVRSPRDAARSTSPAKSSGTNAPPKRKLIREREYEKLAAYFNLDNGAGKIRGVYLQGNEAVRPLFRRWLAPFADLDAETLSLSNTGGTDHLSFDAIGLAGFEFIQDPLDYGSRTHHSNQDVFDRIQPDDLKQAATIIAAFVYNAATVPDKLPRKPVPQ